MFICSSGYDCCVLGDGTSYLVLSQRGSQRSLGPQMPLGSKSSSGSQRSEVRSISELSRSRTHLPANWLLGLLWLSWGSGSPPYKADFHGRQGFPNAVRKKRGVCNKVRSLHGALSAEAPCCRPPVCREPCLGLRVCKQELLRRKVYK